MVLVRDKDKLWLSQCQAQESNVDLLVSPESQLIIRSFRVFLFLDIKWFCRSLHGRKLLTALFILHYSIRHATKIQKKIHQNFLFSIKNSDFCKLQDKVQPPRIRDLILLFHQLLPLLTFLRYPIQQNVSGANSMFRKK